MIILQRLQANNFKGLHSVDILFPERGSLLIEGYNEAGKSTLFEAVYVALYGKPLVGEDERARQEEVIQHGQSLATVELTLCIGQQRLIITRIFERGKSQSAKLIIQPPGVQPEIINRVRAVDERILKELGNLDGESLRNSCFVEQKELGRIEALQRNQREQAIQKLLGLERLTRLMEQFKFKREQERELALAEKYLALAHLQVERSKASAEETELKERLNAVQVARYSRELTNQAKQKDEIERLLHECTRYIQKIRDRLNLIENIKAMIVRCDQATQKLVDISHTYNDLNRLKGNLDRLEHIEHVDLPSALDYLRAISDAREAVVQVVLARKQAQVAQDAVLEAQRQFDQLKLAESEQRRKEEELSRAQARVDQRHQEAEAEQQRILKKLSELETRKTRLEHALTLVEQWETACQQLSMIQQDIIITKARQQTLITLQAEAQRRESELHDVEAALHQATQEMQQTANAARIATAYENITAWMRLKGVEIALNEYTTQQKDFLSKKLATETALATARRKTQIPLFAGIVLMVLTVLTFVLGFIWLPAFALFVCLLGGAIVAWIQFIRARKNTQQQSNALAQCERELQRLDLQRQVAIQTGGDPAALHQYEQQLQEASFAIPSSIHAGQKLQEELQQQSDTTQGNRSVQDAARFARDNHIRLVEQHKLAQLAIDESNKAWHLVQQSGNPEEQLDRLRTLEVEQERNVAIAEQNARQSLLENDQWPTTSNTLQTVLSSYQAELQGTSDARKQQELTSTNWLREAVADREKAHDALQQAKKECDTQKASDPATQLSYAQESLLKVQAICRQHEETTQRLLQKVNLQEEKEVEPERGRAEARIQALEKELGLRPVQLEEYKAHKDRFANELAETSSVLQNLFIASKSQVAATLPAFSPISHNDNGSFTDEQVWSATLLEIKAALQNTLTAQDEPGTKNNLDAALQEQGKLTQQKDLIEGNLKQSQQAIDAIFTSSHTIIHLSAYTYEKIVEAWPLVALVSPEEESQVRENLERVSKHLYATRQQEDSLTTELHHPGTPLHVEECLQKVNELCEEREISGLATRLLRETHERIARRVLPITERNMQPLLQQLTGGRYRDVRLTPGESNDQPREMDYRIRVWDPAAGRFVAKNLFSGGTRDQCSLALRLAFALATLPQELGVAPGFIFLDEPLSAFDAQRAQALVELLTVGTIAQHFNQVVLISHFHAFDREAFHYHIRMEAGQIIESDLPTVTE